MFRPNRRTGLALVAASTILVAPARAADEFDRARLRGTIEAAQDGLLAIRSTPSDIVVFARLSPQTQVTSVTRASLADVRAGVALSVAADASGPTLRARGILLYPAGSKLEGGRSKWDAPDGALVTGSATAWNAQRSPRALTLSFKGGTASIDVAPDVPIARAASPGPEALKKGAAVLALVHRNEDGAFTADRLVVGTGDVKPPF